MERMREKESEQANEREEELFFLFGKFDFHCDISYFANLLFRDSNRAE